MRLHYADRAVQFEPLACRECGGTGKVKILDRARLFLAAQQAFVELKCPQCNGTGRSGVRVKSGVPPTGASAGRAVG